MRTAFLILMLLAGTARAQTNDVASFLKRLGQTTARVETLFVEFAQDGISRCSRSRCEPKGV